MDIAERFTHAPFTAHGVGMERVGFQYAGQIKRKIGCNAVCKLLDEKLWWKLVDGKRLAMVSGPADELAALLLDSKFVKATGGDDDALR